MFQLIFNELPIFEDPLQCARGSLLEPVSQTYETAFKEISDHYRKTVINRTMPDLDVDREWVIEALGIDIQQDRISRFVDEILPMPQVVPTD